MNEHELTRVTSHLTIYPTNQPFGVSSCGYSQAQYTQFHRPPGWLIAEDVSASRSEWMASHVEMLDRNQPRWWNSKMRYLSEVFKHEGQILRNCCFCQMFIPKYGLMSQTTYVGVKAARAAQPHRRWFDEFRFQQFAIRHWRHASRVTAIPALICMWLGEDR